MTRETHQVVTELIVDALGTVRVLRDVDAALGKTEQSFENTQAAANGLAATAPRAADVLKRGADAQAAAASKMMGAYDASSKSVRQLYQVYGSAERAMNPVVAAEVKYQRQIAATQELLKRRVIDEQRAASTLSALREQQIVDLQRYKQAAESADQADRRHAASNDNVARGRRQGLMFQSFDIGTTLAGGMNPALILAQQGPQIVQLYAGNGGVNAAIEDMSSLLGGATRAAGPLGVVVLGLGVAFADFKSEIEESTGVAVTWGQVFSGTFTYIAKSIRSSLQPAIDWIAPYAETAWGFLQNVAAHAFNGVIRAVETAVNLIQFAIAGVAPAFEIYGKKAANAFVDAINWMYDTAITPINKLIDAINWITQAGDSGLDHLTPNTGLIERWDVSRIAVEKYNEALKRFEQAQAETDGKDYLKEFKNGAQAEILKKNADAATESFKDQKKAIDDTVESLRLQVRTFGQSEGAIARARFEIEQFAAAKAKAAEDKTTFSTSGKEAQQIRDAGKEVEVLTNRLKELGEAQKRNEALKDRETGRAEQLRSAQEELTLIGKTALVAGRLRAEYEMMADARQAMEGGPVSPEELARIKEASAELARINQQIAVQSAETDILFERSLIGLSEPEQQVRQTLRGIGVEYDSVNGQRLAGEMRYNKELERTQERMNEVREIASGMFTDMFSGPMDDMDVFFDKLIDNFARIGQMNLQNVFDQIFGVKGASAGGGFNLGALGKQIGALFGGGSASKNAPVAVRVVQDTVSTHSYTAGYSGTNDAGIASFLRSGQSKSHIEGMSTDFAEALGTMLKAAPEAVRSAVTINSGFRSIARQGQLFDAAVQKYGSEAAARKWVAPPGNSQHNKGNAADLGYSSTAAKEWFHQNASKYGLAFPLGNEDWHLELAGVRGGTSKQTDAIKTAMAGLPSAVETGAIAGTETGAKTGIQSGLKGVGSDFAASQAAGGVGGIGAPNGAAAPAQGGGMFGGAGMQNLSIGLGAFGMGAQSGSPLSGALGGAMSGMAGGPIGMLIGGAAGILGGIFGKSRQRKAEQAAAKKALKEQMGAIEDMLDYASGTVSGGIVSSMREYRDEVGKATELATKAGDKALKKRLKASIGELEARLIKDFKDAYEGTIEGLNKGLGLDNPFSQGFDAVKSLREELLAFVDDAKTAGLALDEAIGGASGKAKSAANSNNISDQQAFDLIRRHRAGEDISGYANVTWGRSPFSGGKDNAGPNAVYMDRLMAARDAARAQALAKAAQAAGQAEEAERQLSDARKAAINQALSVLTGPTELTAIAEEMMELRGKAAALPDVLKDLGLTSEQAAQRIEESLGQAIAKIRDTFTKDLIDQIDDLDGKGYLPEFRDLFKTIEDMMSDAKLIGADTALVDAFFKKSAQSIVDGAELTGQAFNDLIAAFPQLVGVITPFLDKIRQEASTRLDAAIRERSEAENKLRSAYEESTQHLKNYREAISDFLKDMRLNADLSVLDPGQRLAEAKKLFDETAAKARAGDEKAQNDLVDASQRYLKESLSFNASTEAYYKTFNEVQAILKQADAKAATQLTTLDRQVGALIDINENTKSIAELIKDLTKVMSEVRNAEKGIDDARDWGIRPVRNHQIVDELRKADIPEYRGNFGPNTGPIGSDWWLSLTLEQREQAQKIIDANVAKYDYATGGLVTGPGTGTSDSIRANLSNGEYVMPAAAVSRIGVPALDTMRATMRMPSARQPANDAGRGSSREDLGALAMSIARSASQQTAALAEKLDEVVEELRKTRTGNRVQSHNPRGNKAA